MTERIEPGRIDPANIDPAFRALPLARLADAALSRARELGAEHADVRVERIVSQSVELRDAGVTGVVDSTVEGLAVRVRRRRHVGLRLARRSHAGTRRGDRGTGRRRGPGAGAARPRAGRAGRRAGARRGRMVFGLHDRPADGPDGREGRAADRLVPAPARRSAAWTTSRPGSRWCGRTSSTPTWPAPRRCSSGSGPPRRSPSPPSTTTAAGSRP